jgi:hypothetical protein
MRITPAQAREISRGAKTQLRVPVDTRITATPLRPARRHSGRPATYNTGDILAIDSDTRTYCKIVACIRAPLGTLTQQEAEAEGHPTVDEFEIDWVERHDHEWLDRQINYLIEVGTPADEAEETRAGWARSRYQTRWAAKDTWHLTIEPFDDLPVLLPGLPEEPEAIPPDRIHTRWNIKSARRYQQARDLELRTRDAKQLARRVKLMKLNQPDAPEIALIEEHLRRLEMRLQQAA